MYPNRKLFTDPEVCVRLGRSQRTIDRWAADPATGFPQPVYIRGRKYRDAEAVEAFEASMLAKAGEVPPHPRRKSAPASA
jgi:predicted DNA-binding transcriptional regulator AlpA